MNNANVNTNNITDFKLGAPIPNVDESTGLYVAELYIISTIIIITTIALSSILLSLFY